MTRPTQGGSYRREADGSLRRIEIETPHQPAAAGAAPQPSAAAKPGKAGVKTRKDK